MKTAKFSIGQVVRHRLFPFRGIIFDVDPQFANTDEWYEAIPADVRPRKDQPFYHLLAENSETEYIAYVSEQNLLEDRSGEPVRHPQIKEMFDKSALLSMDADSPALTSYIAGEVKRWNAFVDEKGLKK
jgi:heat shock protein HspQ